MFQRAKADEKMTDSWLEARRLFRRSKVSFESRYAKVWASTSEKKSHFASNNDRMALLALPFIL